MAAAGPRLRWAAPEEAEVLSALALVSKAHWGYSADDLSSWKEKLALSADSIRSRPTVVVDHEGHPVAVLQLTTDQTPWVLECLWVHPDHMKCGYGRALVLRAVDLARDAGQHAIAIDSDPHAEAFYLRLGARVVGQVQAPLKGHPERIRPQLVLDL